MNANAIVVVGVAVAVAVVVVVAVAVAVAAVAVVVVVVVVVVFGCAHVFALFFFSWNQETNPVRFKLLHHMMVPHRLFQETGWPQVGTFPYILRCSPSQYIIMAGEALWHFTVIPSPLPKMKASWWPLLVGGWAPYQQRYLRCVQNCFGFGKAFQNRFALRPRACGSSWPSVPGHRFREFSPGYCKYVFIILKIICFYI